MSRSVRRVLSVAAAIAIPYAAPALAASGFMAPIAAKIGATGASALAGAGLGAASARIGGGDVGRGALLGAVGGGLGGLRSPAAGASQASAPSGPYTPAPATQGPPSFADQAFGGGAAAAPAGLQTMQAGDAAQQGASFSAALREVPSQIAERFRDPQILADLTLRAAGMLAGSAIAGDGLSSAERKLLAAQAEDLQNMRQQNEEVFRIRLQEAQRLIGESAYFDPEYFGLMGARDAQLAGGATRRVGLRGMTGDRRATAARQYDLGIARNVGTGFQQGYSTGVQGRLATRAAGLAALPTQYPSTTGDFGALMAAYGMGDNRRRQTQQDIGDFFGVLTGREEAQRGDDEDERLNPGGG